MAFFIGLYLSSQKGNIDYNKNVKYIIQIYAPPPPK